MPYDDHSRGCGYATPGMLERVRFFPRQLLTADDMRAEQEYFRQRQRLFNRFVVGWGVVCGLEVKPDPKQPDQLVVRPGYALDPCGGDIHVPQAVKLDLARCLAIPEDPCAPSIPVAAVATTVYVAIRSAECLSKPVRTTPFGCGCDETACEYSRIRDGFELACLTSLPRSHEKADATMTPCEMINSRVLPPCPPEPADAWVVVASTETPMTPGPSPAVAPTIDNITHRRVLWPMQAVHAQILAGCEGLPQDDEVD